MTAYARPPDTAQPPTGTMPTALRPSARQPNPAPKMLSAASDPLGAQGLARRAVASWPTIRICSRVRTGIAAPPRGSAPIAAAWRRGRAHDPPADRRAQGRVPPGGRDGLVARARRSIAVHHGLGAGVALERGDVDEVRRLEPVPLDAAAARAAAARRGCRSAPPAPASRVAAPGRAEGRGAGRRSRAAATARIASASSSGAGAGEPSSSRSRRVAAGSPGRMAMWPCSSATASAVRTASDRPGARPSRPACRVLTTPN